MNVALAGPLYRFDSSICFGWTETHQPLGLGFANALLGRTMHRVLVVDGGLTGIELEVPCRRY